MQRSDAFLDIQMHHHRGVLPMRAARGLGVPPRINQPHERLTRGGQRRPLLGSFRTLVVIALPLGEQRITMRLQGRIELRGIGVRKLDPPRSSPLFQRYRAFIGTILGRKTG